MTIKIKAKVLHKFLKSAFVLNGEKDVKSTHSMADAHLDFREDALYVYGKHSLGTMAMFSKMDKEMFDEYSTLSVMVQSTDKLMKVLSSFKDKLINITVDDNKLYLIDEKSNVVFGFPKEVECSRDYYDYSLDFKIDLDKDEIKQFLDRCEMFEISAIEITNKNNLLMFKGKTSTVNGVELVVDSNESKSFNMRMNKYVMSAIISSFDPHTFELQMSSENDKHFVAVVNIDEDNKTKNEYVVSCIKK
jgi:hypothetical protein